jgi:hypothetical protein
MSDRGAAAPLFGAATRSGSDRICRISFRLCFMRALFIPMSTPGIALLTRATLAWIEGKILNGSAAAERSIVCRQRLTSGKLDTRLPLYDRPS